MGSLFGTYVVGRDNFGLRLLWALRNCDRMCGYVLSAYGGWLAMAWNSSSRESDFWPSGNTPSICTQTYYYY